MIEVFYGDGIPPMPLYCISAVCCILPVGYRLCVTMTKSVMQLQEEHADGTSVKHKHVGWAGEPQAGIPAKEINSNRKSTRRKRESTGVSSHEIDMQASTSSTPPVQPRREQRIHGLKHRGNSMPKE